MSVTLILSAVVLVAGLILYFLAAPPKLQEAGRLAFFAGLLVCLLHFSGHAALSLR